jgi:hypothetical protein
MTAIDAGVIQIVMEAMECMGMIRSVTTQDFIKFWKKKNLPCVT